MTTILTEKVRPVGFNTDTSPKGIEAGNEGNRAVINPVIDCLNKHYHTSENGMSMEIENIRGTTSRANSLPVGNNVCIGTYEDKLNNQLIFFNWNSGTQYGVYAYSPETDTIRLLISKLQLFFSNQRQYMITGVGSMGQLLYWSDGLNPQRVINMTVDYTYAGFTMQDVTLYKLSPTQKLIVGITGTKIRHPQLDREVFVGLGTNKITNRNFQFSYRLKFIDNEYSVTAPFSDLSYGDFDPKDTKNSKVLVAAPFSTISSLSAIVKQTEFLVRENNTDNWKIWHIFQPADTLSAYFTNSEAMIDVDQVATSKISEAIPNFSKALAVTKNKVFLTADQENFDQGDNAIISITQHVRKGHQFDINSYAPALTVALGTFSITLAVDPSSYAPGDRITFFSTGLVTPDAPAMEGYVISFIANVLTVKIDTVRTSGSHTTWTIQQQIPDPYKTYWKTGAIHVFGIAVFDSTGQKCMGVVGKTRYNFNFNDQSNPDPRLDTPDYSHYTKGVTIDIAISGVIQTGSDRYWSLVATEDQYYQTYWQTVVRAYYYRFEAPTGYTPSGSEIVIDGKVFLNVIATSRTNYAKLYLQVPQDLPVVLDTTWYCRPYGAGNTAQGFKILEVIGDFIVIDDPNGVNSTFLSSPAQYQVELYVPRSVPTEEIFYELTDRFPKSAIGPLSASFNDFEGPVYLVNKGTDNVTGGTILETNRGFQVNPPQVFTSHNPEAPYITSIDNSLRGGVVNSATILNAESPTPIAGVAAASGQQKGYNSSFVASTRILIQDYTKVADNRGKGIVDVIDKKAFPRTSTIRFSNKYVQDTNINGLSTFDTGDQYTLAYDRGPITKLQPIANRMLAIHERATTILYLNEKMIKTADGLEQLIATGDTIGYDSQLEGNFGCYHPESIVKVEDDVNAVFGFDIYKGVVWRYTLEGQYPISNYGRKQYFRDKANTYISNKNGVKIIGGHDPFHKEYLITFNDGTGASETIAFNYVKKVWTTRYSFIPEYYGKINNKLISFQAGALFVHNDSNTYNNFYGVQYPSFINIAVNPHPTRVKNGIGIDLDIESISTNVDFKQVEIYTPENQYSYLKSDEWLKKENVFYADILRDVNTQASVLWKIDFLYTEWDNTHPYNPGDVVFYNGFFWNCAIGNTGHAPGTFVYWFVRSMTSLLALREGDDIRSRYFKIQINDDSTTRNLIQQLNLQYVMSEYSQ